MQFRSYADLNDDIARSLAGLPFQPDLVVGIPRSGLLAASMVSILLNIRMASVEGFAQGQYLTVGKTKFRNGSPGDRPVRNVLILDDSVSTGLSLRQTRATLSTLEGDYNLIFAAVYGESARHPDADLVFHAVPQPRMFQWNIMHHDGLRTCCVDIDGVLCFDPTHEQNDDGAAYLQFLAEADSFLAPTKPIGALVTNRLEKYRSVTEAWLAQRGIEYGELHMLDAESAEERRRMEPGAFKADVYKRSQATLFIESEYDQAAAIAHASDRPVLCTETWELLGSGSASFHARQAMQALKYKQGDLPRRAKIRMRRLGKSLMGETGLNFLKRMKTGQ